MKLKTLAVSTFIFGGLAVGFANAGDCPGVESPDAKKIMLKDIPPGPRLYAVPKNCKLDNPKFIAKMAEKGKKLFNNKKIANCVACHNAPGSKGAGNIGPDLTGYMSGLYKAPDLRGQKKSPDWVFQRIADYRVQIPEKFKKEPYFNIMTVNLTTGKLSYDEVCAITAFLLSLK